MKITFNKVLLGAALAGVVGLCTTGCESFSDVPSGELTSITITNQPMKNVVQSITAVFLANGFSGGQTGANQLTFTRLGSRSDNLAYGSYMFDQIVTINVVVITRQLTPDSIFVGCKAWLVEAARDPVAMSSHQVRSLRKWPYEKLLKDIQTQLGQ